MRPGQSPCCRGGTPRERAGYRSDDGDGGDGKSGADSSPRSQVAYWILDTRGFWLAIEVGRESGAACHGRERFGMDQWEALRSGGGGDLAL